MVIYAAKKKYAERVFVGDVYRATRESGEHLVVKICGTPLPLR